MKRFETHRCPMQIAASKKWVSSRAMNDFSKKHVVVTGGSGALGTAVVTEQGGAPIWGHDERTQARHLIEHAAHPDVREELWEEAAALGLA